MREERILLVLVGLYALLALNYIETTPYRTSGRLSYVPTVQLDVGAPDERQHVNYVRYVARNWRFPVFRPGSEDSYETYQSHQPPLYYTLCAPISALVGTDDPGLEKWALRLVNVILGIFLILLVRDTAVRFTGNRAVALYCAGLVALLPMFLALSTAVTNDVLLYLVVVLGLNRIAAARQAGWTVPFAIQCGAVLGVGMLTKTTALSLAPVLFVAMLLPDRRAPARSILIAAAVAAVVGGPWLLRNQFLYGDPLVVGAFQSAFGGTLTAEESIGRFGALYYWGQVAQASAMSFWGIFSYFDIEMPFALYVALTASAAVAGIAWLLRLPRTVGSPEGAMHLLNAVLLATVLAMFLAFNLTYYQAQARYLYPALFPIACGIGFGLWEVAERIPGGKERSGRRFAALSWACLGTLLAVNLYVVLWLLPSGFYRIVEATR